LVHHHTTIPHNIVSYARLVKYIAEPCVDLPSPASGKSECCFQRSRQGLVTATEDAALEPDGVIPVPESEEAQAGIE